MVATPANEFDFTLAYTAEGWSSGIAWRAYKWEELPDADTEWTGILVKTGKVVAHMVGDDENFSFEPTELIVIQDGDYCPECGQVGCKAWA